MKQLTNYKLNKYNEVSYIKRFVIGVTPQELEEIFGVKQMKTKCQKCGEDFEDVNYEKFGNNLNIRIWCNKCIDELENGKP